MSTRFEMVVEVHSENTQQVSLAKDNHVAQAFSADRAHKPLTIRGLPGRPRRANDFLDTHVLDALLKERTMDAVAITNQEAWSLIVGERLDNLLSRPLGRGMLGDVEVDDMSSMMTKNDEGKQYAESGCRNGEEIDRDNVTEMILEKRPPGLRRRLSSSDPILSHRSFGHNVPQQGEFGLNPRGAPGWILVRHAADQSANLGLGWRPPGFAGS